MAAPACLEDRNFDRCGGSRAHLPRCARGLCRGCSGGSGGGNHVGRPYELVGDASFTLSELVSLASEAAGKPIAYKNMRLDDLKEAAIRAGLPEMFAIMLSNTDAGMANGALFENGGELARLIGRPTTPVQSTIRSFYTEPSVAAAGRSLIRVAATQMVQAAEVTSARRTSVMKTVFAPAFLVDGDRFNYADELAAPCDGSKVLSKAPKLRALNPASDSCDPRKLSQRSFLTIFQKNEVEQQWTSQTMTG